MKIGKLIKELEKLDPESEIEIETQIGHRWGIDRIGPHESVWADDSYPAGLHAVYVS